MQIKKGAVRTWSNRVIGAKGGKTCRQCQAREKLQPVPAKGGEIVRLASAGKHAWAKSWLINKQQCIALIGLEYFKSILFILKVTRRKPNAS